MDGMACRTADCGAEEDSQTDWKNGTYYDNDYIIGQSVNGYSVEEIP